MLSGPFTWKVAACGLSTVVSTLLNLAALTVGLSLQTSRFMVHHSIQPRSSDMDLAVAKQNLRAIFDGIHDAVIIHNQKGQVIDANARMLDMFGVTQAQVSRFSLFRDYSGVNHSAEQLMTAWSKALLGETQHFEWTARRPLDGNEFEVEVVSSKVVLNGVGLIFSTVRDVSLRKASDGALRESEAIYREKSNALEQALTDLQQAQFQLVQSEKMSSLGQLVAGVAHEINNPVNFIYGNLTYAIRYTQELLTLLHCYQENYPEPLPRVQAALDELDLEFLVADMPRLLSSMKVGADRIRDIVRSLRNFSRLDEADCKPVDIHEGLDSTLMILQNRLKPKATIPAIAVIKHYGELPLVECYAGQLNQVFMNILTNAIDALEERDLKRSLSEIQNNPSIITITTEQLSPQADSPLTPRVLIRIADNGPGIPDGVQKRLFDPFFTTKAVGKGTGLGMSISQQIVVDKHQGQLLCRTHPEAGTEFIVEIPIKQTSQSPAATLHIAESKTVG